MADYILDFNLDKPEAGPRQRRDRIGYTALADALFRQGQDLRLLLLDGQTPNFIEKKQPRVLPNGHVECAQPLGQDCTWCWRGTSRWEFLLAYNRTYLSGQMCCTPYSKTATPDSWNSILGSLLRLHLYGILTCEAGPGNWEYRLPQHDGLGQGMSEVQRRPWLKFCIPTAFTTIDRESVSSFTTALAERSDIALVTQANWERYGHHIMDHWKTSGNVDADGNFALTRSRLCLSESSCCAQSLPEPVLEETSNEFLLSILGVNEEEEEIEDALQVPRRQPDRLEWLIEDMICPNADMRPDFHGPERGFAAYEFAEPICVMVAAKDWNAGFDLIERAIFESMEVAGMDRVCPEQIQYFLQRCKYPDSRSFAARWIQHRGVLFGTLIVAPMPKRGHDQVDPDDNCDEAPQWILEGGQGPSDSDDDDSDDDVFDDEELDDDDPGDQDQPKQYQWISESGQEDPDENDGNFDDDYEHLSDWEKWTTVFDPKTQQDVDQSAFQF